MKHKLALAICVLAFASLGMIRTVHAQATQVSTSIGLNYLNVQLSYPSEILPAQVDTITVQATAKNSFRLVKLTLQVYYGDGGGLRTLTIASITNNTYLNTGNQITKQVQFNVPADTPRTSLVALVSESVEVPQDIYAQYYYPYSYWYYYPFFYYTSPTLNISPVDDALAPLSYVKATTPEYLALQNQYQVLQQQLNQSQAQNQQLQQNLQNTTNEKNSMISDLSQQLAATQTSIRTLEAISLLLTIIAIVLGFLLFRERTRREKVTKESPAT